MDNKQKSFSIEGLNNNVTQFSSGAVRDIQENKGRMDLLPLSVVGDLVSIYRETFLTISHKKEQELSEEIFKNINSYIYEGDTNKLLNSLCNFIFMSLEWCDYVASERIYYALLDVSMHYKKGLEKYGERNWEKGIPLHSYIDSGVRHYIKWCAHFTDERHDLAFIWNLLCCCHTHQFIRNDSLQDLPFCKIEKDSSKVTNNKLGWNLTEENK